MELYYDEKNLIIALFFISASSIASYFTGNWWILLSSIILIIQLWVWVGIFLIKFEDRLPTIKPIVIDDGGEVRKIKVYCTNYFGARGNDYNFYLNGKRIAKIPKGGVAEIPLGNNPVNLGVQSTGLEINNHVLHLEGDDEIYVVGNNNHDNLPHTNLSIVKDVSKIDESAIRSEYKESRRAIVSSRLMFFVESLMAFIIIIFLFDMI